MTTSSEGALQPETAGGPGAVLAALGGAGRAEVRETHISYVFLAGDSAFKLKKPVVLPFLDYGSRERRRRLCHEEVRLNSRLAPSVYRAVLAVVPDGDTFRLCPGDRPDAVEHVVWMRRFREDRTLAARVAASRVAEADAEAVGARLARFHEEAAIETAGDPCAAARASAEETFAELSELRDPELVRLVDAGRRFTDGFLRAHGAEMRARRVVDGHGDLRAEHVLLEGGGVEVVDCVEFDPALRHVDPGADLAFLVMDLIRLGAAGLARALVRGYEASGGDAGDDALLAFHAAQRAWVRAKVALVRARQVGEATGSREVRELLELARRLSWRARRPLLLLVGGLSRSGKSTLAAEIGRISGAPVLSSDVVRKQLAGVAPGAHAPAGSYSAEASRRTYTELGRLADRELRRGGVVIVDATFRDAADRAAFVAALGRWPAGTRFVECVAPVELRAERAAAHGAGDASDATPAIAVAQRFDPVTEVEPSRHIVLHTDRPPAVLATEVEERLDVT